MERIDINKATKSELTYYTNTFIMRKNLLSLLGGCPQEEIRVKGRTNCFNCDECWIAALEKVMQTKEWFGCL